MWRLLSSGLVPCLLLCTAARAAEHVTLKTGFVIDCTHHERIGDNFRLYTSANDKNYMDVAAGGIAKIEVVPDKGSAPQPVLAASQMPAKSSATFPATMTQEDLRPLLLRAGAEHRIDEDLLYSVIQAESAGHTMAISHAGAQGLMQLMPQTAAVLGVNNTFVPEQNVNGGAAYLDQLLTRYRDNVTLALAAYNAGPQAVDRYHGVPPYTETRVYVRRVILEFNRRKRAARMNILASK